MCQYWIYICMRLNAKCVLQFFYPVSKTKLWVSGLSLHIRAADLKKCFGKHGKVMLLTRTFFTLVAFSVYFSSHFMLSLVYSR